MEALRTPHAARLAALFAVLASATAMAIEEPRFKVLEQQGSFELREYPAYVVAETRVEAGFASAGNIAFQRLFELHQRQERRAAEDCDDRAGDAVTE